MRKLLFVNLFGLLFVCTFALAEQTHFSTIGSIHASAQSKLGSQVSGRVEQIFVEVGDAVKKGQPLLKLDTVFYENDYAQENALLELAKIELIDAEINLNRMRNLWEKPAGVTPSISQKQFEDAKTRFVRAGAQLKKAQESLNRAKVSLDEATIKAPYDGIITDKFVDAGEAITATPAMHLVEIEAIDMLYLDFSIPQSCLSFVKVGTPVLFEIEGVSGGKSEAKIERIYPSLDESTRSVKCRAIIKHPGLRPGLLAKIEIGQS
jgi:membrane fusion protein (multidrug efflux system)